MSVSLRATLTLLRKDYDREEVALLMAELADNVDPFELRVELRDEASVSFTDFCACNGEFEDIEKVLQEMGVPYDRFSEASEEMSAEVTQYRPEHDSPITTYTTPGGETVVTTADLKNILEDPEQNAETKLQTINALIKEVDFPFPFL